MSRPRYYWHNMVRKQISINRTLPDTRQSLIIREAIKEANKETLKLPDGELRLKAVKAVLIDKRLTYEGAGLEFNYSWQTIKNWVNAYVNLVGRKAGY